MAKPVDPQLKQEIMPAVKSGMPQAEASKLYVDVASAISHYNNDRIHLSLKMSRAAYAAGPTKPKKGLRLVFGEQVA